MFDLDLENTPQNYEKFVQMIKKENSFAVTGLTSFLRIFLLYKLRALSGKKILFVTSSEQNALKYQNALMMAFELDSDIMPFQNCSVYETIRPNLYDYCEQIKILKNKPDIVICPTKAILEKFPDEQFFEKNTFKIKIGDVIDLKELAQKLVNLGYNKSTMVNDIGEFSIRGDIADIYSLDDNPVRIEFWGDEVVDIRYFNNETQKSVLKSKQAEIMPIYKFTLEGKEELSQNLQNKILENNEDEIIQDSYFDGIEVYQNYFNDKLVSILDYFEDYILVFDETSEIYSKYEFLDDNFNKQLEESLKLGLIIPYNTDAKSFKKKSLHF